MSLPLLATALLPLAGDPAPSATVELQPKAVRTWTLDLPADPFRPVSGAIPLPHAGGAGFPVEARGVGLAIDTDGDGEVDREVEGREHPETKVRQARVVLEARAADGTALRYPVRLENDGAGWRWASGGVLTGEVGGSSVTLVDMDGNGSYGDVGRDAVAVDGDVAQFLGRSLLTRDGLLGITVEGSTLGATPYAGPTGTLDLRSDFDAKGVLLAAVVKSVDGLHSFELSRHEDPVTVPVGRYRLVKATLGLGDSRVTADASRVTAVRVDEGSTGDLVWGGPVKATFVVDSQGGALVLDPSKVRYEGAAGEVWTAWEPVGKSPSFRIKDKETGDVLVDVVFPGSC